MSDSVTYEPFLTGYDVVFHEIFTLIDPGMNTSEIKPLHLAIPRNLQPRHAAPAPAPAPQVVHEDKRITQRLLSKRVVQQQPTSPPEPKPQPESKSPRISISTSDNKIATETLMKIPDFWILPLDTSMTVRFVVEREADTFVMKTEATGQVILSAKMNGKLRREGIEIMRDGEVIGEGRLLEQNSTFYCGVKTGKAKCECCAAVFNPSFTTEKQPRVFDFLIPALKKIDGRNTMFAIDFKGRSGLLERMVNVSKEAIRLKTRVPVNSGNTEWDMTYDGKLAVASMSNFVIYHDSSVKKDLCVYGKIGNNQYELELGYPMSPLQGFLAGVIATMPI